jgi:hypothetical protein
LVTVFGDGERLAARYELLELYKGTGTNRAAHGVCTTLCEKSVVSQMSRPSNTGVTDIDFYLKSRDAGVSGEYA